MYWVQEWTSHDQLRSTEEERVAVGLISFSPFMGLPDMISPVGGTDVGLRVVFLI